MAFETQLQPLEVLVIGGDNSDWEVLSFLPDLAASGWDTATLKAVANLGAQYISAPPSQTVEELAQVRLLTDWKIGNPYNTVGGRWIIDAARIEKITGGHVIIEVNLKGLGYDRRAEDLEEDEFAELGLLRLKMTGSTSTANFPGIYSADIDDVNIPSGYAVDLIRPTPQITIETIIHGRPPTWVVGLAAAGGYQPLFQPEAGDEITATPFNPQYQFPYGYVLTGQEWDIIGIPSTTSPGPFDEAQLINCLTWVRDTWTYRRVKEPGPEE